MWLTQTRNLLILSLFAVVIAGCGITAPSSNDGFADLDSLGFRDVDRTMSLSIGPTLLNFAARNIEDDPEAKVFMENLDGVRVKAYDIVGDEMRVAQRIDDMSKKLQRQGWEPIITVHEEGQRTVMLVKPQGERIVGLTVITCDAHEAVIVNVMGELRPEMFAETMAALDVDVPEVQVASGNFPDN
jgi:hypothetical protein